LGILEKRASESEEEFLTVWSYDEGCRIDVYLKGITHLISNNSLLQWSNMSLINLKFQILNDLFGFPRY